MISIHTPIVSSHEELFTFLHSIHDNENVWNIHNVLVAFEDGKVRCVRRLGEFCLDPEEKPEKEALVYEGMTGVKCYGGTGIVILDAGTETNLSCFNKTAIKNWTKKNWKDGVLIDWTNLDENHWPQVEASRESYSWK